MSESTSDTAPGMEQLEGIQFRAESDPLGVDIQKDIAAYLVENVLPILVEKHAKLRGSPKFPAIIIEDALDKLAKNAEFRELLQSTSEKMVIAKRSASRS